MTQDSKLASRGNSFEIENLIKVCFLNLIKVFFDNYN